LVLILLLALGVRLHGLGFGLPYTVHPDEPNVVDRAVITIKTGDWNPHWFIYPSGYHYLQVGVLMTHLLWGSARGLYDSPADLPDSSHTITAAPETYLWARGTTALFGVLTVWMVYLVGRRLTSRPPGTETGASGHHLRRWMGPAAGLAGALLVALSPLHVKHSHYVTTDVPTAALTVLALYLSLEVLDHGGAGRALLAGLTVGAATGFKYNGIVALLPLLLALAMRTVRLRSADEGFFRPLLRFFHRDLGFALLGVLIGFAVTCPFAFADLPTFLDDLGYETHIYRFGGEEGVIRTYEVGGRQLPPWMAYAHALFRENPAAALAFLGGSLHALMRRRKQDLLVLSCAWGYFLFLGSYASIFVRNILPALPGLAALGGAFLTSTVVWLAERPRWRPRLARLWPLPLTLLLFAILFGPATRIMAANAHRARPTSQVQALRWLDEHVPPGAKVAAELHPLLFANASYSVTPVDYLSNYPLPAFVQQGYTYVVANSEHYGPEFAEKDTLPDYYANLLERMDPVADFPGHTQDLPGPRLTIYRVPAGDTSPGHPADVTAGPGLRLMGFDVGHRRGQGALSYVAAGTTFRAGDSLGLTLYLQAANPLPADYMVSLRLLNEEERTVAWEERAPCGGACPPTTWVTGEVVLDLEDLPLSPMLPPGTYFLEAQFLHPDTKQPLPLSSPTEKEGTVLLTPISVLEAEP
jgi:4-amino-4-deoxy-L-arabinose transferase-like glycosyltransferase